MNLLRTYGDAPYTVALIHGGPGAGGEMAPVARRLSQSYSVLEPIQTATSVEGQIEELRIVLEGNISAPITLIGYSWGAWLSLLVAARYSTLVRRLVLVSSGPYEDGYVKELRETRMNRLSDSERDEFVSLMTRLAEATGEEKDRAMSRLGELVSKSDDYDPVAGDRRESDSVEVSAERFGNVWTEAAQMRASGELLRAAGQVQCSVVAIHGDYDPHPAAGVKRPLVRVLGNFRFILLEKCGHTPWIERHAFEKFYDVLITALKYPRLKDSSQSSYSPNQ